MGDELERKQQSRELTILHLNSRRDGEAIQNCDGRNGRARQFFPLATFDFVLVTRACQKRRFYIARSRTLLSSC